jgi:hypothetical protein
MNRVRAMLLLSALGLGGAAGRGDETNWKPAEPKSVAPPPPAAAPVTPPPAPVAPSPTPPSVEPSGWRPAKRYPVDFQPPTTPAPAATPANPPTEPAFRPTSTDPVETNTRELAPSTLPPITPIPNARAIDTPKPADPPKAQPTTPAAKPPSEQLPAPRPATPPTPAVIGGPPPIGSGIVTTLKDEPPGPPLLPHPDVCQTGGEAVAPTRGRVFGSPSLNLSRDFAVRDLFGLDLYTPPRGTVGPDGTVMLDGPATDLFFFQAEYLLWWANRPRIPTLATTSDSPTGFGFLGDPNTRALLGPGTFGPSLRNGMRIRGGGYFDECEPVGLDASFFFLGTARERAAFDSAQFPVITRPFFAPNTATINAPPGSIFLPGEFGEVVARPGLSAGRLEIDADSYLWGADVNYRRGICRTCEGGRGWFLGYRHLNLTERLNITEFITANGAQAPDPVGTRVVVGDRFETRNQFHGGQVGYLWNRRAGRWDLDARASVALGVTHQILTIDGFQQRTRPGEATQVFRGGLLAAGPNLGRFTDNKFSVVPEATFNLGYMVSPSVRLYVGYNFLYWNNVIRPGDQIDRTVDVTFVPNPPANVPPSGQFRPQPLFRQSDLWVQGIQFGAELRW